MELGISGKTAIVCGASRGLGRACAEVLARERVNLVICSRDFDRIFAAGRAIAEHSGVEVVPVAADLASPDTPDKLVREAINKFGGADILVNNAGGPPPGTFEELDDSQWEHAYQLTLMSAVRMSRAALPVMTANRWGRIITLASSSVKQPIPGLMLSNALRSAVVGMAKTLSQEIAATGVTVNTIATGMFETDRLRSMLKRRAKDQGISEDEVRTRMEATIPVGRLGSPEELAWLVAFLASTHASYITGTTIQVDGGMIASLL